MNQRKKYVIVLCKIFILSWTTMSLSIYGAFSVIGRLFPGLRDVFGGSIELDFIVLSYSLFFSLILILGLPEVPKK